MINTKPEKLDRRVIRTRSLLRQAFLELVNEQAFQTMTVQDITDRAMINRATFYAHFEDNYALFDYVIQTLFQDHLDENMPDANSLTVENLRLLSLSTLTFLTQFMGHCAPTERNNDLPFEQQLQNYLRDVLYQWLTELDLMIISADISTDLIATATSSTIFGSVMHFARHKSSLSQDDYIDQLMTLLLNGVCPIVS